MSYTARYSARRKGSGASYIVLTFAAEDEPRALACLVVGDLGDVDKSHGRGTRKRTTAYPRGIKTGGRRAPSVGMARLICVARWTSSLLSSHLQRSYKTNTKISLMKGDHWTGCKEERYSEPLSQVGSFPHSRNIVVQVRGQQSMEDVRGRVQARDQPRRQAERPERSDQYVWYKSRGE